MSVETKRIYKIEESDFYGITQGTRPIVDDKGNITAQVQNPVATIRYENRLIVVEPYQVEFIEDSEPETGNVWHTGEGNLEDIDTRIGIFSEHLNDHASISDDIIRYAQSVGNETMICEFNNKGFKELIITWEEE